MEINLYLLVGFPGVLSLSLMGNDFLKQYVWYGNDIEVYIFALSIIASYGLLLDPNATNVPICICTRVPIVCSNDSYQCCHVSRKKKEKHSKGVLLQKLMFCIRPLIYITSTSFHKNSPSKRMTFIHEKNQL